jgi:uncharacterized protein YbjT (DUF2867 family)
MSGRVVVVAGASGLVGGRCVHHLLAHEGVARVVVLVRRKLALEHAKLEQKIIAGFDDNKALDDAMPKDVDDAYCCLGTTIKKAGSQQAFAAVDRDAVLAFAKAARAHGARRFLLVSSLGADARSMSFYLRTKGEAEEGLKATGFDTVHVLRPSILDGERQEERAGEKIGLAVARVFSPVLGNYAPIHVDTVGRAMVKLAFTEPRGFMTHASKDLQKIGAA